MTQLRQLITLAYVDYIKYPFNHLILYVGDFVWHIGCIDARPHCLEICIFWFFMIISHCELSCYNHPEFFPYHLLQSFQSTLRPFLSQFCSGNVKNNKNNHWKVCGRRGLQNSRRPCLHISQWLINHEKSKDAYSQAMRPCINATNMSNKIPHIED